MSLDQPLTVAAPADSFEPAEPVDQAMRPEQSGDHTAELTSNAANVEPIDSLNLDTVTKTLVLLPRHRASVIDEVSATEASKRSRHKVYSTINHSQTNVALHYGALLIRCNFSLCYIVSCIYTLPRVYGQ